MSWAGAQVQRCPWAAGVACWLPHTPDVLLSPAAVLLATLGSKVMVNAHAL